MRSSRNARRTDFFIPFTALIIVSGLTSIFTAVDIMPLSSFGYAYPWIASPVSLAIICEAFSRVKRSKEPLA